jgi:uncharacterized protein (TIGR00369 family)
MTEPDYAAAELIEKERQGIIEYFKTFPFFNLMGIELVEIEPGRARLGIDWRKNLCQPAGIMHGGAIASLVDTAIAQAILLTPANLKTKAKGGSMVTIDLRIKYLRPVSSGRVVCEARVTRLGRQIVHASAVVTDEAGKEVAFGDSIYILISGDQLRKRTELT